MEPPPVANSSGNCASLTARLVSNTNGDTAGFLSGFFLSRVHCSPGVRISWWNTECVLRYTEDTRRVTRDVLRIEFFETFSFKILLIFRSERDEILVIRVIRVSGTRFSQIRRKYYQRQIL